MFDTTGLAGAIAAMRAAVGGTEREARDGTPLGLRFAQAHEYKAGRALLRALEGVPERLALLEKQAGGWDQVRAQNADLRRYIRFQDGRIAALETVAARVRECTNCYEMEDEVPSRYDFGLMGAVEEALAALDAWEELGMGADAKAPVGVSTRVASLGEVAAAARAFVYSCQNDYWDKRHPAPVRFDADLMDNLADALAGLDRTRGLRVGAIHEARGAIVGAVAPVDVAENEESGQRLVALPPFPPVEVAR